MTSLILHDEHESRGARFRALNGMESVWDYGDPAAEYEALKSAAGLFDLGARGRLGVTGADRQRFLNGQVTNNIKDLRAGEGCYALLVNAKGRVEGDMNVFCLAEELLLDCEPGHGSSLVKRLEQFVVADEVGVMEIGDAYGLLSLQGPRAADVLARAFPGQPLPGKEWGACVWPGDGGEWCVVRLARSVAPGVELFVPRTELTVTWKRLAEALDEFDGRPCGWECLEWARLEAGIPRYGADMDERNLASEAGVEPRAISYTKGCYIGQEVISRIRSVGQVTRSLRGLAFEDSGLPRAGDRLMHGGREVGHVTSAVRSPAFGRTIGLGYVRREVTDPGDALAVQTGTGLVAARLLKLPWLHDPVSRFAEAAQPDRHGGR